MSDETKRVVLLLSETEYWKRIEKLQKNPNSKESRELRARAPNIYRLNHPKATYTLEQTVTLNAVLKGCDTGTTEEKAAMERAALNKIDAFLRGDDVDLAAVHNQKVLAVALRYRANPRAMRGRLYFLELDKQPNISPKWRGAPKTYAGCYERKSLRDKVYAERKALLTAFDLHQK